MLLLVHLLAVQVAGLTGMRHMPGHTFVLKITGSKYQLEFKSNG